MIGKPEKIISYLFKQERDKLFTIKEYKRKRTIKQNSYYWELLGKLSIELQINPNELHKEMLRSYSQRYEVLIPAEDMPRGIEYYDKKSTITKNGKEFTNYVVYVPSHELNTKEYKILLDGLIQECKQQDIETMTPEELESINYGL